MPTLNGNVQMTAVEPGDAERVELDEDQNFVIGELIPDDRRMPDYPALMLQQRLDSIAICVEVETDETGNVIDSRPVSVEGICEPLQASIREAFHRSVHQAVSGWKYEPSYLCSGPLIARATDHTPCHSARAEAVPLLRAYRFVFSQTEGRPAVAVDEMTP